MAAVPKSARAQRPGTEMLLSHRVPVAQTEGQFGWTPIVSQRDSSFQLAAVFDLLRFSGEEFVPVSRTGAQ